MMDRDMTEAEKQKLKKRERNLEGLLDDIESGDIYFEDLSDELMAKLVALVKRQ